MFSKLSVVVASVLITLATASNQCCSSVQSSSSSAVSRVAGVLGLNLSGLNVPIGLSCSPITVAGNNCGGTTVTCDSPDNEYGGLIAINCIPITA